MDGHSIRVQRVLPYLSYKRAEYSAPAGAPESNRVWVSRLSSSTNDARLREEFGRFGRVVEATVCLDRADTGSSSLLRARRPRGRLSTMG